MLSNGNRNKRSPFMCCLFPVNAVQHVTEQGVKNTFSRKLIYDCLVDYTTPTFNLRLSSYQFIMQLRVKGVQLPTRGCHCLIMSSK